MQSQHSSSVIATSTEGLKHGSVQVPVHDGSLEAYFAAPDREGRFPVVLVVQEIFGLHEHIRDICRRFAHEGYLAIAPQLYQRQGDASQYKDIPVLIDKIVSKVSDEQVMQDLDACLIWAGLHGGDVSKVAVTGFFLGWPHHLALRRTPTEGQGWGGLVRQAGDRTRSVANDPSS